jgi:prepilin-type N-terminal cleavage/methylation domain-containing protein
MELAMRMGFSNRKRGFTLVETIVSVGIVAALAAVVYPAVVKQFDSADPARIQQDLKNLQTAIETFNVNLRIPPTDLDDLANAITSTTDSSFGAGATSTSVFLASQVLLWKGPYVDFALLDDITGTAETTRPTAFGATLQDSFVCYNSVANTHGNSFGTGTGGPECAVAVGQKFLAIQITGLAALVTDANFISLNALFDGVGEVSPGANGRIRFGASGSNGLTVNVVYFLAIPLS